MWPKAERISLSSEHCSAADRTVPTSIFWIQRKGERESLVIFGKATKKLHSQTIISNGCAEIVESSGNIIEFGAIGFDIGKVTKFDIIELGCEMKTREVLLF